jgi:hypothetical protein
MSSVASVAPTNPGLTNLLDSLTQIGSPLASSPQVLSALQKASPSDIAELSAEAIQLQGVDALFGSIDSNSSDSSTTDPNSLFEVLDQSLAAPGATSGSFYNTTSNDSNTLLSNLEQTLAGSPAAGTTLQGGLQPAQIQALFGNSASLFGSL